VTNPTATPKLKVNDAYSATARNVDQREIVLRHDQGDGQREHRHREARSCRDQVVDEQVPDAELAHQT
jgi:hypothetical protein